MRTKTGLGFCVAALVWMCVSSAVGASPVYRVLHHFDGTNGAEPRTSIALSGSDLYGITGTGGTNNYGTVFAIKTDGSGFRVLKHFAGGGQGAWPVGGLCLVGQTLYGTTSWGGTSNCGTIFKMSTDGGGYEVLKSFTGADGFHPQGTLAYADGVLFGTTLQGGLIDRGTVYRVNPDGSAFAVIKHFGTDDGGSWPNEGVTVSGTTLYGATTSGGAGDNGAVFQLNGDGNGFEVLSSFVECSGRYSCGRLLLSGSTLYGSTVYGQGPGTLFTVRTDSSGCNLLKAFAYSPNGFYPQVGLALSGATLYGSVLAGPSTNGALFSISTDGTDYRIVKSFTDADGSSPQSELVVGGSTLYGTTRVGGLYKKGVVFALTLPAPVLLSAAPLPNGHVLLSFPGQAGFQYTVLAAPELDGPWEAVTNLVSEKDVTLTFEVENPQAPGQTLFRVQY